MASCWIILCLPFYTNIFSVLECLTTQDINGETALHSAAGSKASGFARFYAKLLTNGSQMSQQSTEEVLQLLDLRYNKVVHWHIIFFLWIGSYVWLWLFITMDMVGNCDLKTKAL